MRRNFVDTPTFAVIYLGNLTKLKNSSVNIDKEAYT